MNTITYENKRIKIVFDKNIQGWHWDKSDIKRSVDSYKDYATIMLIPANSDNFSILFKTYAENDNYIFSDNFIDEYQNELKENKALETKRKLLKEKLSLNTISNRPNLIDYSHLPKDIQNPFNHQKLELEYAVRMPAFYSLDEMGLGKTRVAIERHRFLKEKLYKINKSLVVCPVSLMYNWANEIKKWCPKEYTYMLITGTKKQKLEEIGLYKDKVDFFIINFEGIRSIKNELLNLIDDKTNIIIDEFIKIKNPTAQRSKDLIDICNKTNYVMGLCGTPISQGSVDLFSPSLCIDKGKKFGFSHERFIGQYYCRQGWNLYPKINSTEKISNKLYQNAIRFTKKECLDIPDKMYNTIPIDLPTDNQRVYDQMVNFCMSELEGKEVTAPIILVQLLRLSQITSGFIKTPENKIIDFKEQPKLNAVSDILDNNNGTSVIIWSRFIRDIKALADLCMKKNISFGCIIGSSKDFYYNKYNKNNQNKNSPLYQFIELIKPYNNDNIAYDNIEAIKNAYKQALKALHPDLQQGLSQEDSEKLKKINSIYTSLNRFSGLDLPKTMQENDYNIPSNLLGTDTFTRQNIVDKFQNGDIQIILGTASAGGLGINLTRAERVIYYSNDYSLINRLQSEDRAHRVGQKKSVSYYDIIANNTIDKSILDILMSKKSVADIVTRDNILKTMKGKK